MNSLEANGKIVEKIFRFNYLIDGEEEEDAGIVQIEFSDGSVLELDLVSDGESIAIKWKNRQSSIEESQLDKGFKILLTERSPYCQLKGRKVVHTDELLFGAIEQELDEMVIAGVGLLADDGSLLVYYNGGNYAKLYFNQHPPSLGNPFKLQWRHGGFIGVS
ncbi:hypothetical protein [Catalinimonas alkaloidigena]|uniref:hypothetical protein n=1 Tax=Catalinimonas alkaloidigena TaxID=1075417 RepID=UPI00115FCCE1|nr:hypothetical protein [Catalinimonas alkaloidigena]